MNGGGANGGGANGGVAAVAVSAAAGRALRLSPALTRRVSVRRDIGLRSRDGVILRTDHYAPRLDDAPTVLVRTPYGRTGISTVLARTIAERGFHVVVSSCRGTFGSGGFFDPMRHERDDGLDTVDWLRRQPWFNGRLGTFGPSYVGYTQWAISDVPELKAMATAVTASQFRGPTYAGESFSLHTVLAWAALIRSQGGPWLANAVEALRGQPKLRRALTHLPLTEVDTLATGEEITFFRRWLAFAGGTDTDGITGEADAYWDPLDHNHRIPAVTAPVLMLGGWQDIFLPWQLLDYAALRDAGAHPHMTIGPWTHGSPGLLAAALQQSVEWLRHHLRGEPSTVAELPVRVHVVNDGWREYADWPPAGVQRTSWFPQPGRRLAPCTPPPGEPDTFVYDPVDPTPSVGGAVLVSNVAGVYDNRALERRSDVLVYTSDPLSTDHDIVGPVSATVHARATHPYFDIFVRLCDVEPSGRSLNVCDGLTRVVPDRFSRGDGGTEVVDVAMWPAGHRFRAGHRIRLQISGGAHPRYARNTGTGDPLATGVRLTPVGVEIWHDPEHPSAVHLPFA